jgi:predicted RNA binding protein YcfA (HicA-like mRNA interferase family)
MPRKVRQLKADLAKVGAYKFSQVGSHEKWRHLLVPSVVVILSGHDGDDAKPYQEKDVRNLVRQIKKVEGKHQQ